MSDQICTPTNEMKRIQTSFLTDSKKKLYSQLRVRLCMSINLINMLEIHEPVSNLWKADYERTYKSAYLNQ